jgi:hypothetical protein
MRDLTEAENISGQRLSATLVVELDNLADTSGDALFVESLASWLASIRHATNQGIVCDLQCVVVSDEQIAGADVSRLFSPLSEDLPGVPLVAHSLPATTYYEKKMFGAIFADKDYVVFVDSDVLYSLDWFTRLAKQILDRCPDVVYGETYALRGNRAENSTAVAWQFPLPGGQDNRRKGRPHRWSNNWAVKTDVLLAHPLPRIGGDLKVEGTLWDQTITDLKYSIENCNAEAFHRQPTAWSEWWLLAVRSGRAKVVRRRFRQKSVRKDVTDLLTLRYFREVLHRLRELSRHEASFSAGRVLSLALVRQAGMSCGFVLELLHPPRLVSEEYTLSTGELGPMNERERR